MYKENPEKNRKNRKNPILQFFGFWDVSGQVTLTGGFLGRFQYRTTRFHISSPDPDPFSAENVFFSFDFGRFPTFVFLSVKKMI